MATSFAICNFCDAICGLEIEHTGREIHRIRGDLADPFSHGHICPKGSAHKDLLKDPDRLTSPVRRVGPDWHEIGWEEAISETAERLVSAQKKGGRDAAAVYYGNPIGHNYQAMFALLPLIRYLGSRNVFTSNSVDAYPRMLVSRLLYGNHALLPVPDVERTDLLVIMGANPMVTHGSVMGLPDTKKRLAAIRERGGQIVVIDPRRTETASVADRYVGIRPGTDAYLLLSVLDSLTREGLVRPGHLAPYLKNLNAVLDLASDYPPERTEPVTGVNSQTVNEVARRFGESSRAVWYGRMGTCTQEFGTLATWLIDVLNIVTGKLDEPGGYMFTTPAVDLAGLTRFLREPGKRGRWRSRVTGYEEFNGEFPVAALAEEIDTPGRGQIQAMLVVAGNPVLTNPGSARLDKALGDVGFLASIDYYINETSRLADIIMPPSLALESDQYPALEHSIAIRNTAHYSPAVFKREPGTRHDFEILASLTSAVGSARGIPDAIARAAGSAVKWAIGSGTALDLLLRLGPQRLSLSKLKRNPHGLDLGPLESRLPGLLQTRGHQIDLAPAQVMADFGRLSDRLDQLARSASAPARTTDDGDILLVSKRALKSMNSWMHNLPTLNKGRNSCTLEMNKADAAIRGISDGDTAVVEAAGETIEVTVEITTAVMAGVASITAGWGHEFVDARLSVACRRPGSNMNLILDPASIDIPSGTAIVNGVPARIHRMLNQQT